MNLVSFHVNLVSFHVNLVSFHVNLVSFHVNLLYFHVNLVSFHVNLLYSHVNLVSFHVNLACIRVILSMFLVFSSDCRRTRAFLFDPQIVIVGSELIGLGSDMSAGHSQPQAKAPANTKGQSNSGRLSFY